MNKKSIVLFCTGLLCVGALFGLVACSQPAAESSGEATQGTKIDYDGTELVIALDSNPTTGYEWTQEMTGDGLELVSDDYVAAETSDNTVGSGGVHTFVYEGTGEGTSTLTFTYARNWETTDDDQTLVVEVKTGSDGTIESAKEK